MAARAVIVRATNATCAQRQASTAADAADDGIVLGGTPASTSGRCVDHKTRIKGEKNHFTSELLTPRRHRQSQATSMHLLPAAITSPGRAANPRVLATAAGWRSSAREAAAHLRVRHHKERDSKGPDRQAEAAAAARLPCAARGRVEPWSTRTPQVTRSAYADERTIDKVGRAHGVNRA